MGRPSTFTEEMGEMVLDAIYEHGYIRKACRENKDVPGFPCDRQIRQWMRIHEKFAEDVRRAMTYQPIWLMDEALDIADHSERPLGDKALQVNTRISLWSKMVASKSSVDVTSDGKPVAPVINVKFEGDSPFDVGS